MAFTDPRMLHITPSKTPLEGLIQEKTYSQTKCKDIIERNVNIINDTKQQIGASSKILLTVSYLKSYTLRWYVVQPTTPNPTIPSEWRDDEYQVDFKIFEKIDKLDFFKKISDMICKKVEQSIKIERNILSTL